MRVHVTFDGFDCQPIASQAFQVIMKLPLHVPQSCLFYRSSDRTLFPFVFASQESAMKSVARGWDLDLAMPPELVRAWHLLRASECLSKVSYSISMLVDG